VVPFFADDESGIGLVVAVQIIRDIGLGGESEFDQRLAIQLHGQHGAKPRNQENAQDVANHLNTFLCSACSASRNKTIIHFLCAGQP